MYQYILFDLDGTIINSEQGITKCVSYALNRFNIEEQSKDNLRRFIGPPLVDSFREFYEMSEEDAALATSYYRERYQDTGIYEIEMYPGVDVTLKELKKQGKIIALATSKPEVFANQILDRLSLSAYFDVVVGSEINGGRDKKEDVIEEVFHRLGSPDKSRVLMVGDRKFDIFGAKHWQVDSVGVTYGFAVDGELEKAGATYVIQEIG